MQNIPSHNKEIRQMFKATDDEVVLETEDDIFRVDKFDEVYTSKGWVSCSKLKVGDDLDGCVIKSIELQGDKYIIGV
jgi:hypothetical protein